MYVLSVLIVILGFIMMMAHNTQGDIIAGGVFMIIGVAVFLSELRRGRRTNCE